MKVKAENTGDVEILRIEQDALDAESSAGFRAEVEKRLAGGGRFLLDLEEVAFVDSTGIGAILACLRAARAADGELRLCHLAAGVRAAFEIVRLHHLVEIHATRDEALAAFASSCRS